MTTEYKQQREAAFREIYGQEINWNLAFDHLREKETTKHVHRLHPYFGKYIPQLVEYWLDQNTDEFKQEAYFQPGDIILDCFAGSGTTAVQAAEMGIHCIGVDISAFNALIGNVKLRLVDLGLLEQHINAITTEFADWIGADPIFFDKEVGEALKEFNDRHFPKGCAKQFADRQAYDAYGEAKATEFTPVYAELVRKWDMDVTVSPTGGFVEQWFPAGIRDEFEFVKSRVNAIAEDDIRDVFTVILSRTMRSCRATTHYDLGSLKTPVAEPYWCWKHGKVCRPIASLRTRFKRYAHDTLNRLREYRGLRSDALCEIWTGDARDIELLKKLTPDLRELVAKQGIRGIFSSPPYLGTIDYHEQHAYAYELFAMDRQDDLEIGPMFRGQGKQAKNDYVTGISAVLNNAKQYLAEDYDVFLVANDKHGLYPEIAERAGMRIVNEFLRPVLNRTSRNRDKPYAETIFHLKKQ